MIEDRMSVDCESKEVDNECNLNFNIEIEKEESREREELVDREILEMESYN